MLAVVSLTTLVVAAGCGDDGDTSRARPGAATKDAPAAADERVIATIGDSVVAGSPLWDPDVKLREAIPGADEQSQWQSWVETDATLRNCGVRGERTDQIGLRYRECAKGADAVVVQGGLHDIVGQRDVRQVLTDLTCMVDTAIADGVPVAVADVLPFTNGDARTAADIDELNASIAQMAAARGIPMLPFNATLADPAAPTRMQAALTIDGDHPNVAGYRLLGERAWREPALGTSVVAHRDGHCIHLDLD